MDRSIEAGRLLGDEEDVDGGGVDLVEVGQRRHAGVRRVDAAVELQKRRGRDQEPGAEGAFIRSCVLGFGRGAYEDGAAFEGHVDAGAADLAAGAQRRDHHPVPLADAAGGRPLRAARRCGDGRHVSSRLLGSERRD
jgi:hypothetical protein